MKNLFWILIIAVALNASTQEVLEICDLDILKITVEKSEGKIVYSYDDNNEPEE